MAIIKNNLKNSSLPKLLVHWCYVAKSLAQETTLVLKLTTKPARSLMQLLLTSATHGLITEELQAASNMIANT